LKVDSWPQSYFGFDGRLGLRTFWTRMLIAFLCAAPIFLLPALLPKPVSNAAWLATIVGDAMCQASLTWRRLNDHDLGTRMKLLLGAVPIAGLALWRRCSTRRRDGRRRLRARRLWAVLWCCW
jgi:uncharacterized membrane protein YhaH (DUF805 family)